MCVCVYGGFGLDQWSWFIWTLWLQDLFPKDQKVYGDGHFPDCSPHKWKLATGDYNLFWIASKLIPTTLPKLTYKPSRWRSFKREKDLRELDIEKE